MDKPECPPILLKQLFKKMLSLTQLPYLIGLLLHCISSALFCFVITLHNSLPTEALIKPLGIHKRDRKSFFFFFKKKVTREHSHQVDQGWYNKEAGYTEGYNQYSHCFIISAP